jgi:arylesterase/paraoxonase
MKWILFAVGALAIIAGIFALQTLFIAGEFKRLLPHFAGSREAVTGIPGPEDITIDPRSGMAYVSSDVRPAARGDGPARGDVYGYDLGSPDPELINLTRDFPGTFHPHGISLYSEAGYSRLFVVNHRAGADAIEVFDVLDGGLHHLRTVQGELLSSPNDVLAVGPNRFYATNDHGSTTSLGQNLEDYLRLPKSNVVYFDGSRFAEAAGGIRYANGINSSSDGRKVYVASTTGLRIRVYRRDPDTGALTFDYDLKLRTGVDNIEVDPLGRLWVGCHPRLLTFARHLADPSRPSPSQVLKITLRPHKPALVEEVFLDLGETLSASTVAAVYRDAMLIGAVLGDRFLHCRFEVLSGDRGRGDGS